MNKILVSGLLNIETSLKVDCFPIEYNPIEYPFFGINNCVSGVGFNIAKALKTLGSECTLLSRIGDDINGKMIIDELKRNNIDTSTIIVDKNSQTPLSVVLVDSNGKRKIYCDLKDIQDKTPLDVNVCNLDECDLLVLTNINFNRHLIKYAHEKGITIATDVHVLSSLDDEYNQDFLKAANILFLSNEAILGNEENFIKEIYSKFKNEIIVCGCGDKGAILYLGKEDRLIYEPAVAPKGIVSTVGAGDALFSAFIHFYHQGYAIEECLKKSVLFAGIKISASGGSNGFVSEKELNQYK